MSKDLQNALKSSATFNIVGDESAAKKLAFLPGVYSTMKSGVGTSKVVSLSDPTNLCNAGYTVDQAADDYDSGDTGNYVHVTGTNRVKYRDFLNTVQRIGIRVTKIIIQNKVTSGAYMDDIFDSEIEIARTAIGSNGAMDFIKLQDFRSVNAYDRTKIELDLSENPLDLGPDTFMAMNIPAHANFSIQFCFEA